MNETITFANPEWGALLWLVGAVGAVLASLALRERSRLERLAAPRLLDVLVVGPSRTRRLWRIALLTLAGAAMAGALMRPQMGHETVRQTRVGAAIMICLDVSRSMLAEDVTPNRLERAKAEIRDLLTLLDGDQVGLIAFAGRASVLAPLTPDFGFLRLALQDARPGSVRVGGTRLEEPIRKAVEGFARTTGVSRSIVLITDGEDQDSFVMDAARSAAERGIRIIAIGFGDADGTTIEITDPRTGAVTTLKDASGQPVVTRLDGALLESIALATDGAYIPVGTGALDLRSVYSRHIEGLTRGSYESAERIVRRDLYQWLVLVALAALLGAVSCTRRARGGVKIALCVLAVLPAFATTDDAAASTPATAAADRSGTSAPAAATPAPAADGQADAKPGVPVPEDPRDAYNAGTHALARGELDAAGTLLEGAREQAGTDEAVRFNATFNLGWVSMRRAEAQIADDPGAALNSIRVAAERWRQALALRPDDEAARRNIELASQRALALADQLATRKVSALREQIERLIATVREQQAALASAAAADPGSADTGAGAGRLRPLHIGLLALGGELQAVVETAAARVDVLRGNPPDASGTDSGPDAATLDAVMAALERAQQQLAQARSQLRQRQMDRALRRVGRARAALEEAREQLLTLREVIDLVLSRERAIELAIPADRSAASVDSALWRTLGAATASNIERMVRLGRRLADAAVAAADGRTAPSAGTPPADVERLEQAYALWVKARDAMHASADRFDAAPAADTRARAAPAADTRARAAHDVGAAVQHLQSLRWLFLDLVERLRELTQRQRALNGLTSTAAAGRSPVDTERPAGRQPGETPGGTPGAAPTPAQSEADADLAAQQRAVAEPARAVAAGLQAAGEAKRAAAPDGATTGDEEHGADAAPSAGPDAETLASAAALVAEGADAGDRAAAALGAAARAPADAPRDWTPALDAQQTALQRLHEALAKLQEDGQSSGQDQQQPNGDQDAGSHSGASDGEGQAGGDPQPDAAGESEDDRQPDAKGDENGGGSPEPEAGSDPARTPGTAGLLQGIRDREAARREARRRAAARYAPVERDW